MVERAPAKINLDLRILSREPDGYHRLETLFQALELHDVVEARPADALALEVEGDVDTGPAQDNLVLRAARAFLAAAPDAGPARLRLVKRIPAGAGLGGGSSDAAATLRALDALAGEPLGPQALREIGARLGSDVPFFLCGSPLARAQGRGERLTPLLPLPSAAVLVVDPGFPIATRDAFGWWDEHVAASGGRHATPEPGRDDAPGTGPHDFEALAAYARNDFEPPVFARHPSLAALKRHLLDAGATLSLLSGSGSCVWAVFRDDDRAAAAGARAGDLLPGARVLLTRSAE